MNMFLHELKAYRKSTIIWTASLIGVIALFLSFYPSIAAEADEFNKLMEGYPEAIKKALDLTIESLTSVLGYYSYVFLYVTLCGAIQAMNIGISILSKELREKTADFLLTKPVKRSSIMTAKLFAAVTVIIITNLVYITSAYLILSIVAEQSFNNKLFFMISITLLFIQIIFLALGVILSVILPKVKSQIAISLGTVFTFFIISMIGSSNEGDAIRYFTPFQYFKTSYIINNSSYESNFIILAIAFVIISIFVSYIIYSKKDVHAV